MATVLRMPEVAANAMEAVLQEWPIAENTPFRAADTIATVETEKAVVDVEAETDGVILKTLVPAGSLVEVGAPIAILGASGESVDDLGALLERLGVAPTLAVAAPERRVVADPPSPPLPPPPGAPTAPNGGVARIFTSPLARRLARDAHLSVEQIAGTGPGGRIIRRDVEAAIANRAAAAQPAVAASAVARSAAADQSGYTDQPHSRVRRAIASRLAESKQTVPHFYLRAAMRVNRLLKLREQLNQISPTRISVNDLVLKAAAHAQVMVPAMNVLWTAETLRSFTSVDIGVAIASERGLVTPVLRSVEQLSIAQIAAAVKDFATRANAGRLRQDELEGGTLSVTNLGMYGTEEFDAIINPPQAAILAVGAARDEPIVRNGKLRVGTVMRVTLSVDHRPVDGVVAAQWMKAFVSLVENPLRILV